MLEILDIIDENNNVIGKATRDDILEKKILHRGVAIVVFNSRGEILRTKELLPKKFIRACGICFAAAG